jgi:hypothetical protein
MNDVRRSLRTVDSRWFFRPTRDSIERDCSAVFDILMYIYLQAFSQNACREIGRERNWALVNDS